MISINLHTWFCERELNFCPKHFVMASTPITEESKQWILERLTGRFYLQMNSTGPYTFAKNEIPCFEDPTEATLYELTWS